MVDDGGQRVRNNAVVYHVLEDEDRVNIFWAMAGG